MHDTPELEHADYPAVLLGHKHHLPSGAAPRHRRGAGIPKEFLDASLRELGRDELTEHQLDQSADLAFLPGSHPPNDKRTCHASPRLGAANEPARRRSGPCRVRWRDGVRRITHIVEVVGCEGDIITTQDLFTYHFTSVDKNGMLIGEFKSSGLRPKFTERAEYFGLDKALIACI